MWCKEVFARKSLWLEMSHIWIEKPKKPFSLPTSALKMSTNILPICKGRLQFLCCWNCGEGHQRMTTQVGNTWKHFSENSLSPFSVETMFGFCLGFIETSSEQAVLGHVTFPQGGATCSFNSFSISHGKSDESFHHTLWTIVCAPSQYCMSVTVTLEGKGKRTSNKNICWEGQFKELNSIYSY